MKREFLEELGLDKEQIDSVMKEHGKTLNDVKSTDYDDLKKQIDELNNANQTLASENEKAKSNYDELESKFNTVNKTNLQNTVALKAGIPMSLASRLNGETLEELEEDAKSLVDLIPKKTPAPMKTKEIKEESTDRAALRETLQNLRGE